jgi:NADH-quinone oxidoreductase subunit F
VPVTPVLTKRWSAQRSWTMQTYESLEGYRGLRKALAVAPAQLVELIKAANLRGRGGGGFVTGMKWAFIPDDGKPHYLVVNADEGEPGTCRDAPLMMNDPHALIEGIIISSYAVHSNHAFIYVRGELVHARRRLDNAIREAYAAGYLGKNILGSGFDLELTLHSGAGAYICGEETALLDSLEGFRGQPRLKPPFPAIAGLYALPTVINNVGTLASVPSIVLAGADWWKSMGTEKSPGTAIHSLSGRVTRPGQYEAPMGTTLRELLEMAGGVREGHELKFWTSGGSSLPMLTAEHIDEPIEFNSSLGNIAGTGATMIFDDTDCVVRAVKKWSEFYAHESCGKCTPCREGTYWYVQIYERLERGEATEADIDLLLDISESIAGKSFCPLGDGATSPVIASIKYFRDEYIAHYEGGGCPFGTAPVLAGAH